MLLEMSLMATYGDAYELVCMRIQGRFLTGNFDKVFTSFLTFDRQKLAPKKKRKKKSTSIDMHNYLEFDKYCDL